jgi:hypothetical protein
MKLFVEVGFEPHIRNSGDVARPRTKTEPIREMECGGVLEHGRACEGRIPLSTKPQNSATGRWQQYVRAINPA